MTYSYHALQQHRQLFTSKPDIQFHYCMQEGLREVVGDIKSNHYQLGDYLETMQQVKPVSKSLLAVSVSLVFFLLDE